MDAIRALAADGRLDDAHAALRDRLQATPRAGLDRLPWAQLCAELGLLTEAIAELRGGLREAPGATALRDELDFILEDSGEEPAQPDPPPQTSGPTDADLVRFVHLFGGREGVYARQWYDPDRGRGGYAPVRAPMTPQRVREHLSGRVTLGAYVVRVDDTSVYFVLDLDLTKRALRHADGDASAMERLRTLIARVALDLRAHLATLGLPTLLVDSGYKGRHLWGLFERPVAARLAWHFGRELRRHTELPREISLECFPKQPKVPPDGLGNLVKLPLGVHRRSDRRARLLDEGGQPLEDPWPLLRNPPRISQPKLLDALQALRTTPAAATPASAPEPPATIDLEAHAELRRIRGGCAVLDRLIRQAAGQRRLDHDARIALAYSLGHLEDGPAIVNTIFDQCPEIPHHARLGDRHRGHPISCARIRERLPALTGTLRCFCEFQASPGEYPNPLLHLREPEEGG